MRWTEKIRTPDRTGRRASRASLTPEDRERIREERRKRRIERTRLVARVPAQAAVTAARGVARAPVIVVRYPALALIDVWRYWRAERTTLRQGMAALSISAIGNLPTGLALGFMTGRLKVLPGLFILIPAAIGMRGNIFGALGSRLGTSIHAGLFQVSMDKRGVLYQNVYAATLLTFMTSLFLAVVARVVSSATGLASISIWDFVVISVLGGVFSSAFILVLTVALAREGYRRNWDLDAVAAPLITFMGDLITLPALFAASYVAARGKVTLVLGIACALVCGYAFVMAVQAKLPTAKRILAALDISLAGPWAVLNFGLTGVTAHFIAVATNKASPGLFSMVGIALLAGAFSTAGAAVLAYATAVATFRFGLDPDNHGIPMITSSMDLAGVLAVVGVVVLLGVR